MMRKLISLLAALLIAVPSLIVCVSGVEKESEYIWFIEVKEGADKHLCAYLEKKYGIETIYTYDIAFNGFSVSCTPVQAAMIAGISTVTGVWRSGTYSVLGTEENDASAALLTDAERLHSLGYRGEGTVIAVIDSGYDLDHPYFVLTDESSAALTPDKVRNTAASSLNSSNTLNAFGLDPYINAKIPYAFNYYHQTVAFEGTAYHGTHVAGIAAGNGALTGEADGAAPEAQLLLMNVSDSAGKIISDHLIYAAFEDAIALGADVINISLGMTSGFTGNENAVKAGYLRLIEKANQTGVAVFCAAGNEGMLGKYSNYYNDYGIELPEAANPDCGILSEPATFAGTIAVGASNSPYFTYKNYFYAGKEIIYSYTQALGAPDFFETLAETSENAAYDIAVIPGIGDSSDYDGIDAEGKIALVTRGEITFEQKIINAAKAGALAVIVYDNTVSDALVTMKLENGEAAIPAVFVCAGDGNLIKEAGRITLSDGKALRLANPEAGTVAYFSSWGVTPDLTLAPDLCAPGTSIRSSAVGGGFTSLSGTSMSTPLTSGCAALLLQYMRENGIDEEYFTSLLMSSAQPLSDPDSGTYYSPRLQGAGELSVTDAVSSPLCMYDSESETLAAKISVGEIEGDTFSFDVTVTNLSDKNQGFRLSSTVASDLAVYDKDAGTYLISGRPLVFSETSVKLPGYTGGELNINNSSFGGGIYKTLNGGQSATYTFTVRLSKTELTRQSNIFKNGFFIEGFVLLTPGTPSMAAGTPISLPYCGFYGDWDKLEAIDSDSSFYTSEPVSFISPTSFSTVVVPSADGRTVCISPDGDGQYDAAGLRLRLLRNVRSVNIDVTDADGNPVLSDAVYGMLRKAYADTDSLVLSLSDYVWDGCDPNNYRYVYPDGIYTLTLTVLPDTPSPIEQIYSYTVIIDTAPPVLDSWKVEKSADGAAKTLFLNVSDENSVIAASVYEGARAGEEVYAQAKQSQSGAKREFFTFDITDAVSDWVYVDISDSAQNIATCRIYVG